MERLLDKGNRFERDLLTSARCAIEITNGYSGTTSD